MLSTTHTPSIVISSSNPHPATLASLSLLVEDGGWFTVTLERGEFRCTCAEYRQYRWCEHAHNSWRKLEPGRVKLVAFGSVHPEAAR